MIRRVRSDESEVLHYDGKENEVEIRISVETSGCVIIISEHPVPWFVSRGIFICFLNQGPNPSQMFIQDVPVHSQRTFYGGKL